MLQEQERVLAQFFDECARKGQMAEFTSDERAKLERFFEMWRIQPGDKVLEPGCGSGCLTELLAAAVGARGEVLACDISKEMARRAQARDLPDQAQVVLTPASRIPRENDYFDKVICLRVFPHFCDEGKALAEIVRVMKPAAHLWIHHLESREAINALHRSGPPEIASHLLPEKDEMTQLLRLNRLGVAGFCDSDDSYTVHAIRNAT